jgi:hypothetical protein
LVHQKAAFPGVRFAELFFEDVDHLEHMPLVDEWFPCLKIKGKN